MPPDLGPEGAPYNTLGSARISDGSPAPVPRELGPVIREEGEIFGTPIVTFVCSCGHSTARYVTSATADAEREMRHHLAAEHSTEVGHGLCAECGQITDWLRARSELGDAWLCPVHAPETSLRSILGSQEADVTL